jgi:uncharacterized repeat protein (TIGR04138 family)
LGRWIFDCAAGFFDNKYSACWRIMPGMLDFDPMPPTGKLEFHKALEQVVDDLGVYPIEAYFFIQQGLAYTVNRIYGTTAVSGLGRHVTGQQLCHGLRELALKQWGYLASTVLRRWNITQTVDFGRIVFSMARHNIMKTTPDDTLEDFRNVYQFSRAFDSGYRINAPPSVPA